MAGRHHDSRRDAGATENLRQLPPCRERRASLDWTAEGGCPYVFLLCPYVAVSLDEVYCTTSVMGVVWLNCPELATTLMV